MIHDEKDKFRDLIDRTASFEGFYAPLVEKDYYLSIILSKVHELSDKLMFKGGTCLNKIYYSYYRLSEDLDFSMLLPEYEVPRAVRRKLMDPIKDRIEDFARQFGVRLDNPANAGRNESKQYIYNFVYDSVILPVEQSIKFEIGLRFSPIKKPELKKVQHKFLHSFTRKELFDAGTVNCLVLDEIVSEKLRAAALRKTIVPRDFYDLDFILRNGFDLARPEVMELFRKKILEDAGDPDIKKYILNMGRTDTEIKDMKGRIEVELFDVLTVGERKNFNIDAALKKINAAMSLAIR